MKLKAEFVCCDFTWVKRPIGRYFWCIRFILYYLTNLGASYCAKLNQNLFILSPVVVEHYSVSEASWPTSPQASVAS